MSTRSQADGHHDDDQVCYDCGRERQTNQGTVWGFTSLITQGGQSRWYCSDCKVRRGLAYQFDDREWSAIEREQKGSAVA